MRRVIWPNWPQALCGLVLYFLALSTETYGRKTPALGTLQKRNSVSNATGISLPGSSLGDAPSIISTNNGGLGQETKGKGGAVSSAKPGGLSSSLGGVEGVGVQIGGAVGGSTVPLGNLGMGISNPLLVGSSTGNGGGIEAGGSPAKADQFIPGLTRQVFKDIDGFKVKDLTASPKFPNSPDEEDAIAGFSVPSVPGESWGEKIFGYFKAPDDGDYTFYISSNAESELHVSTDQAKANLRKYASVGNREILQPGEYDKYPGQVSTPVRMTKNDFYFFEVLHKQLFGQSHLQVGVKFPNGTKSFPVPNDILFTRKDAATNAAGDTSAGGGATGGGAAGMGATGGGGGGGDAAVDPLAAAAKAGLQAGLQQGAQAGQDAGKKAGEQAGSEAGERAGLQAAAAALGITIDELQARKAQQEERKKYVLKVKVYSANFPCANPGGHVCKYALSILEDNTATLNPREEATVFILRKPALNGQISAFSLEMDAKRDFYLKREFGKFVVDRFDASPGFGKTASFALEGKEDVLPASSAIKLADNVDDYLCHATASSTLLESKFSKDCTFHFVHPELDNNLQQRTCTDYCRKELQVAPKTDEEQATAVETLSLLNALAQKATIVASEKLAAANQQHIKALKETVSKVKSEASMLKYATEQAHSQLQAGMQGGVSVDSTHPGYGSISEAIKDNPMSQANKNGPEFEDHVSDDSHSWIGTDTAIGKKMIAVRFINHALNGTKIVSNLKPDGYALSTDRFKLKIIFKSGREPKVTFHGVDTTGAGHPVYLDGKESLTFTPTEHQDNYIDVEVKSGLTGRELHEVLKNEKHPQESDNTLTQKSITARKHESTEDKHQVPETKARSCKQKTEGGNANGRCCVFPFTYKNAEYDECTQADSTQHWCATTSSFDEDRQYGYCSGFDPQPSIWCPASCTQGCHALCPSRCCTIAPQVPAPSLPNPAFYPLPLVPIPPPPNLSLSPSPPFTQADRYLYTLPLPLLPNLPLPIPIPSSPPVLPQIQDAGRFLYTVPTSPSVQAIASGYQVSSANSQAPFQQCTPYCLLRCSAGCPPLCCRSPLGTYYQNLLHRRNLERFYDSVSSRYRRGKAATAAYG